MAAGDNLSEQFHGQGMDSLFPPGGSEVRVAPWKTMSRRKDVKDYDESIVHEALANPPELQEVDPRNLRATQPMITRGGVDHYANSAAYNETGETYADKGNVGNKFPFVYRREDGQDLLLSGHHRAAEALVNGKPLRAIVKEGPWGGPRK